MASVPRDQGIGVTLKVPLLLLGIALAAPTAAAQTSDRPVNEALATRAGDRLRQLHQEAESLAAEARTLLGDLRKLEVERQIKTEEFRKVDAAAKVAAAEMTAIARAIDTLEKEELSERPILDARMVELYKLGQGRYLKLLLTTTDARRLGEASRIVSALAQRDRDRIDAHRRRLTELTERRTAASRRSRELETLRAEAARAQTAAIRAVESRDALVRDVDRRRDLNAQLAGELQLAQQKLQLALREGVAAAGAPPAVTPPGAVPSGAAAPGAAASPLPLRLFRGALEWPVTGPGVGVRSRFPARVGGVNSNGMQIRAPEDAAVRAVHDGTVAFAGLFAGYGRLVIVEHEPQTFSLYGYLLDIGVAQGAKVAVGQALGSVGSSIDGQAGLYFELRIDGRPVDPLQWLKEF